MVDRRWNRCVVMAAVILGGCTQLYWVKNDGTWIADNPGLLRQLETDKAICNGRAAGSRLGGSVPRSEATVKSGPGRAWSETSATYDNLARSLDRAADSADVFEGCMAERGYRRAPAPVGRS
ncbi:hypothetical protein [Kaistia sp. MMO-174]|uniref:hypothetical protein n=1 Tax=Kaistia sp. MMO-174 TaxID=3081256 RepID=UPI0030161C36